MSTSLYKNRAERQLRKPRNIIPYPPTPRQIKAEAARIAKNEKARVKYAELAAQREPRKFESDAYSVRLRLQRLLAVIKWRCRTKPRYAGRGIKCLIGFDDLLFIWNRDRADTLRRASIDRIDNDGHYERSNIRFIEFADNVRRGTKVRVEIYSAIQESPSHPPVPARAAQEAHDDL